MWARTISMIEGSDLGSSWRSASHKPPKVTALPQWIKASSTLITSTLRAAFSCTLKRWHSSGSTLICALPFTRKASLQPGIKNSSPIVELFSRLRMPSQRLLPGKSGSNSVFSSSTTTKPASPPLGEQSIPFSPTVEITTNVDDAIS